MTEERSLAFPVLDADQQKGCRVYPRSSYTGVTCEILIVCDALCVIQLERLGKLLIIFQQKLYLKRNKSLIKA